MFCAASEWPADVLYLPGYALRAATGTIPISETKKQCYAYRLLSLRICKIAVRASKHDPGATRKGFAKISVKKIAFFKTVLKRESREVIVVS